MGIWIALFITFAVIGSVLWVKPSPREKNLGLMRAHAMSRGFKVRLLDMKLAAQLFPWLANYRPYVFYEKPVPANLKPKTYKARVVRLSDDPLAHEVDQIDELKQLLAKKIGLNELPDTVEALVISASGLSLLWKEKNEMGDMTEIAQLDNFISQCLALKEIWQ